MRLVWMLTLTRKAAVLSLLQVIFEDILGVFEGVPDGERSVYFMYDISGASVASGRGVII